jgi:DNA-binding transcriptional ArsR family regulator
VAKKLQHPAAPTENTPAGWEDASPEIPQVSGLKSQVSSNERREFERAVVAFFTDAAQLLGVPYSVAAIYGVIFASPEPLTFSDISARLDLSKGSISQGLKALRDIGAVRAESEGGGGAGKGQEGRGKGQASVLASASSSSPSAPSSLRDRAFPLPLAASPARTATRYAPDTEMRKLIERFLESRVQPQLTSGKDRLAALKQLSAAFPPSDQAILRQRVEKLQAWHDRTRALVPLVHTFLKLSG